MSKSIVIPLSLERSGAFDFEECEVIQGVTLAQLKGDLNQALAEKSGSWMRPESYVSVSGVDSPVVVERPLGSHILVIDEDRYFEGVIDRMRAEGKDPDAIVKEWAAAMGGADGWGKFPPLQPENIFRQVMVSVALLQRMRFYCQGFHFEVAGGDGNTYDVSVPQPGPREEMPWVSARLLPNGRATPPELQRIALQLDRYYRAISWGADRLSTAVNAFWSAICTPYSIQTYLSLGTMLEALCNTDKDEISHQLAERVAILLEDNLEDRLETYGRIKRLYGLRSELSHGQVSGRKTRKQPPRGVVNWGVTYIAASRANVAIGELEEFSHLCIRTLRAVLARPELMQRIQSSSKNADDDLRKYYLGLVLGRTPAPPNVAQS